MSDLDAVYRRIGHLAVLNFATKGGKVTKKKNCVKGWECGYTCLPKTKENCGSPLEGQSKTYADWLSKQAANLSTSQKSTTKAKAKTSSKKAASSKTSIPQKIAPPIKPDGRRNSFAEKWEGSWNAPSNLKNVLRILDDPEDGGRPSGKNAFYIDGEISIGKDFKPTSKQAQAVWRHEYGHYIDDKLSKLVKTGESAAPASINQFFSTGKRYNESRLQDEEILNGQIQQLKESVKGVNQKLFKKAVNEGEKVQSMLAYKLNEDIKKQAQSSGKSVDDIVEERISQIDNSLAKQLFDRIDPRTLKDLGQEQVKTLKMQLLATQEHPATIAKLADIAFEGVGGHGVANDLISSTTKNKIGVGHSDDYYGKNPIHKQNTESFANIVSLHGSGDPLAIAVAKRLAPNQFNTYEQALAEALQ